MYVTCCMQGLLRSCSLDPLLLSSHTLEMTHPSRAPPPACQFTALLVDVWHACEMLCIEGDMACSHGMKDMAERETLWIFTGMVNLLLYPPSNGRPISCRLCLSALQVHRHHSCQEQCRLLRHRPGQCGHLGQPRGVRVLHRTACSHPASGRAIRFAEKPAVLLTQKCTVWVCILMTTPTVC